MAPGGDVGRWRWRDRRTLAAIVVALVLGIGVAVIAGLVAGSDVVTGVSIRHDVPSTFTLADGFDAVLGPQLGGMAALVAGIATIATLRFGLLETARSGGWTRRRALIVGSVAAFAMVGPWFALGWKMVTILHATSHPLSAAPVEPLAEAVPWVERFSTFDPLPALGGMVAVFLVVAVLGSLFRWPSSEPRSPAP